MDDVGWSEHTFNPFAKFKQRSLCEMNSLYNSLTMEGIGISKVFWYFTVFVEVISSANFYISGAAVGKILLICTMSKQKWK